MTKRATFRDHFASIFQSAVEEAARRSAATEPPVSRTRSRSKAQQRDSVEDYAAAAAELLERRITGSITTSPAEDTRRLRGSQVSATATACVAISLRYLDALLSKNAERIAAVEGEFRAGACDPAWATTIQEYLRFFGPSGERAAIPYIAPATVGEGVIDITDRSKIALFADWGTGAGPAKSVLRHIGGCEPDILIHLGDVYYSGTPSEYASNFKSVIDEVFSTARKPPLVYVLSGNHDMYCGGLGFYGILSKLNPEPHAQKASFFCLRKEDWQCLALDTGLHDYSPLGIDDAVTFLRDDEFDWHLRRIAEFSGKTVLLSHHQLFSAFSRIGAQSQRQSAINGNLLHFLGEAQSRGSIPVWFWGHEHSLGIYEAYAGLARGRCIGHGAVPVELSEDIYTPISNLARAPRIREGTELGGEGGVYAHGFAILELGNAGKACRADYFQVRADQLLLVHSEEIS